MKQILTVVLSMAALALAGNAAPICTSGSLSSYIALGVTGCTIGTDTISNFQTLSGITGSVAISPALLTVAPSGGSANPTLTFNTTATTSAILEAIFTYRIAGASFTGSMINLSNTNFTGNGVVTDIQNLCGAGTFSSNGVSGCSGTTLGPLVSVFSGPDQTSFTGKSFLSVTDDFTIDGSGGGTASGGTFADQFTAVPTASSAPEPSTILITSLGGVFLLSLRSRFTKKKVISIKEIL